MKTKFILNNRDDFSSLIDYIAGIIDSSGIRIRMTPKLRKHDVGSVNLGAIVTNYQVIPPGEKAFVSRGYCGSECITQVSRFSEYSYYYCVSTENI